MFESLQALWASGKNRRTPVKVLRSNDPIATAWAPMIKTCQAPHSCASGDTSHAFFASTSLKLRCQVPTSQCWASSHWHATLETLQADRLKPYLCRLGRKSNFFPGPALNVSPSLKLQSFISLKPKSETCARVLWLCCPHVPAMLGDKSCVCS